MIIYTQTGDTLLDIPVDDNSYRYRAIRQGDKVYLYFSLAEYVEIPVYSYIEYQGQTYTLWRPEDLTKHGTRNIEYAVTFGGAWELLNRTKYKHLSAIPHRLKFTLTGKPRFFLQLLVDNLNVNDSGWSVGTCIDATEKTLAFSHEYCMEALNRFADEWDTEFEFAGKTINFGKVEYFKENPLPLSYGRGNGFKTGVGRQNQGDKAPVSILYVQGGERNIDPTSDGSSTLLLPKSQELEYEGRRYKTDEDGMYITRADRELPNHNEDSYDASDIYPSRVGTVSEVIAVDAANNLYDIKDSSIPDDLDYAACRIPGEKATIIFQSGVLTGEEFDIEQTDEALTGYIHAERRFKLVPVEKEGGTIPNENRKPSVGDTYAVFNISLPSAYVCDNASKTGASWDMFREAVRYLYENEEETFTFKGELDGIWSKSRWLEVGGYMKPGTYIYFSDTQFQPDGVNIRITGVKDYINRPYSPEVELSNTPVSGFVSSELGKIDSNEVKGEDRYKDAIGFTQRRFRDAKETMRMLEDAIEGFSEGIDPIYVQTMSLLIGAESLQFRFVDDKESPVAIDHPFTYNQQTKVFSTPAGIVQHMTLGITELSSEHRASEYRFWDVAAYDSPPLDDKSAMYLYAKCDKDGDTGTFLLSLTAYKLDPGDGYYYLLVGTLGSEVDGIRSWTTLYGFTEIGPGWMRLDKIISPDGRTYFDVANGRFVGDFSFRSASGWENIEGLGDAIGSASEDAKDFAEALFSDIAVGVDNLLLNTGFTGDYTTVGLSSGSSLATDTELFSEPLKYWTVPGSANVIADTESRSGFACVLSGTLSQQPIVPVEADEDYTLSFRAKGSGTVTVGVGGMSEGFTITSSYKRYVAKLRVNSSAGFFLTASANATVCEIKLERGTVATDWEPSSRDNDKSEAQALAYKYVLDAVRNETNIYGGLVLTNILMVGNYVDGEMTEVTGGISGVYNDGSDVAFWAGGTLDEAIRAVSNPALTTGVANAVITHGGLAILNNAYVRGTVYANDGVFRGTIYARSGVMENVILRTKEDGQRVEINPTNQDIVLYNADNKKVGIWEFGNYGSSIELVGDEGNEGDSALFHSSLLRIQGGNSMGLLTSNSFSLSCTAGTESAMFWAYAGIDQYTNKAVLIIQMDALPTSKGNLVSGQLYRDGDTLKIVE